MKCRVRCFIPRLNFLGGYGAAMEIKAVDFCGIFINSAAFEEVCAVIEKAISDGEPSHIVTPNADHIVRLQRDALLREVYRSALLVLADGMPVVWALKVVKKPVKGKMSGSDLLPKLCGAAAEKGYKVFFLGGRPGAAVRAAEKIKRQYPGISIKGVYSPPFGFENDEDENRKIIGMLKSAGADILFAGLGTPKQEKWIYKHKEDYRVPVSIGVGAAFDFTAGFVKRAPVWMQKSGLEWFYRLVQEPGRLWKRYLAGNAVFAFLVFREWIKTIAGR